MDPSGVRDDAAGGRALGPLAEAIVRGAREVGLTLSEPTSFDSVPGHGVEAVVDGGWVLIGNRRLMDREGVDVGVMQDCERVQRIAATSASVPSAKCAGLQLCFRPESRY